MFFVTEIIMTEPSKKGDKPELARAEIEGRLNANKAILEHHKYSEELLSKRHC